MGSIRNFVKLKNNVQKYFIKVDNRKDEKMV